MKNTLNTIREAIARRVLAWKYGKIVDSTKHDNRCMTRRVFANDPLSVKCVRKSVKWYWLHTMTGRVVRLPRSVQANNAWRAGDWDFFEGMANTMPDHDPAQAAA